MKELRLSLKKKWFDMTKSGIKIEDYREINEYWFKRLVFDYKKVFRYFSGYEWDDGLYIAEGVHFISIMKIGNFGFVPFDYNVMTLGYPKSDNKERILKFEHDGIEIRMGNPEWGAEPNKYYFVIKHGKLS